MPGIAQLAGVVGQVTKNIAGGGVPATPMVTRKANCCPAERAMLAERSRNQAASLLAVPRGRK